MRNGWLLAVAACAGLAVLVLVARGWRGDSAPEASTGAGSGAAGSRMDRSADSGSAGSGAPGGGRPWGGGADTKRGAAAGAAAGGGTDSSGARRRLAADAVRSARQARQGDAATGDGSAVEDLAGVGATAANPEARQELKEAVGEHAARQANDTSVVGADGGTEPIPEVAYEGGPTHTFATDTQTAVPDAGAISGGAGTVSFWLKPQWEQTSQDDATFVQLGDSGLQLVKNVNYLRLEYLDTSGAERGLGTNIADWPPGEWRQVTATWDDGHVALYVDGKLISQALTPNLQEFPADTRLYVGSNFPGNTPVAAGELSYLTVLNRSAPAGEISTLFESGPRPR